MSKKNWIRTKGKTEMTNCKQYDIKYKVQALKLMYEIGGPSV